MASNIVLSMLAVPPEVTSPLHWMHGTPLQGYREVHPRPFTHRSWNKTVAERLRLRRGIDSHYCGLQLPRLQ